MILISFTSAKLEIKRTFDQISSKLSFYSIFQFLQVSKIWKYIFLLFFLLKIYLYFFSVTFIKSKFWLNYLVNNLKDNIEFTIEKVRNIISKKSR